MSSSTVCSVKTLNRQILTGIFRDMIMNIEDSLMNINTLIYYNRENLWGVYILCQFSYD